jgi:transcription termination factor Rho
VRSLSLTAATKYAALVKTHEDLCKQLANAQKGEPIPVIEEAAAEARAEPEVTSQADSTTDVAPNADADQSRERGRDADRRSREPHPQRARSRSNSRGDHKRSRSNSYQQDRPHRPYNQPNQRSNVHNYRPHQPREKSWDHAGIENCGKFIRNMCNRTANDCAYSHLPAVYRDARVAEAVKAASEANATVRRLEAANQVHQERRGNYGRPAARGDRDQRTDRDQRAERDQRTDRDHRADRDSRADNERGGGRPCNRDGNDESTGTQSPTTPTYSPVDI